MLDDVQHSIDNINHHLGDIKQYTMFNAPRSRPSQNFNAPFSTSTFDPLAQSMTTTTAAASVYEEVDPWSSAPSPSSTPAPDREERAAVAERETGGASNGRELLSEDDIPPLYTSLYDTLDPTRSGQISIPTLHRLFASSGLAASQIEKIVSLVAEGHGTGVSRQRFFVGLGLVGLGQQGKDISIETLSSTLPLPLPSLRPPSSFTTPNPPTRSYSSSSTPTSPNVNGNSQLSTSPWDTAKALYSSLPALPGLPRMSSVIGNGPSGDVGIEEPERDFGSGGGKPMEAQRGWWRELENVEVGLIPEKEGWFLTKYRVEGDKRTGGPVSRRYSDFVWLLDCLVKRYPFRLLPALPPKRIGPDLPFLEARRKSLRRFLTFIVNHPILSQDGCVIVFMTEPNFENWRKRTKVSLEEESKEKTLDPAQEMGIPGDVDTKVGIMREQLPTLLESYGKLVKFAEVGIKRLEISSGDQSRMAMTLATIGEAHPGSCYANSETGGGMGIGKGGCELCKGVGRGLGAVGEAWAREGEEAERRTQALLLGSLEDLKTQRDLYVSFRDLLIRHDRLSKDSVDAIRKKVDTKQKKLEALRMNRRPGWEAEEDKLVIGIETDNSLITSALARRVFIKHCMWHELSLVMHSRSAAGATLGWRRYAKEREEVGKAMAGIWGGLGERLDSMPIE